MRADQEVAALDPKELINAAAEGNAQIVQDLLERVRC